MDTYCCPSCKSPLRAAPAALTCSACGRTFPILNGMPNVTIGYQILKPGGWYFEAGWDREQFEDTWTAWAIQHGFEKAEQHTWQYPRLVSDEEEQAWQIEQAAWPIDHKKMPSRNPDNVRMTIENLLIAQKPLISLPSERNTL